MHCNLRQPKIGSRDAQPLRSFFKSIDALAVQLLTLPSGDLAEISHLLGSGVGDGASGIGED